MFLFVRQVFVEFLGLKISMIINNIIIPNRVAKGVKSEEVQTRTLAF